VERGQTTPKVANKCGTYLLDPFKPPKWKNLV
jgi:hypothetical protein